MIVLKLELNDLLWNTTKAIAEFELITADLFIHDFVVWKNCSRHYETHFNIYCTLNQGLATFSYSGATNKLCKVWWAVLLFHHLFCWFCWKGCRWNLGIL